MKHIDSNSSDSSSSESHNNPSSIDDQTVETPAGSSRQPLSRRGHFKSRLGCFHCKRRRIKCNELRPSCSPCRRLGLTCNYPSTTSGTALSGPVRPSPSVLSLEDLRFYHQFLTGAFPTIPIRADKVWAQCAAMSHQSECLANAVLALGASHLTQHGSVDYTSQALNHRVTAIKLINEQFIAPPKDADTADALFAAVICLATQTSLLPDGMTEYLTITRAGALVWAFVIPCHESSLFISFTNESHDQALSHIVSEEPKNFQIPNEFLASVNKVKPLCEKPYELQYFQCILNAIEALRVSSLEAWKAHATLWRAHCFFTNEDFQAFISPENYLAQLLIVHMFLVDYVLGPFCVSSSEQLKFSGRKQVIISWARNLLKRLPPKYKPYGEWIKQYCDTLENSDGRYLLSP
ncbi:hypothetical protein QQS21_000228 [Conoideocrella luteorostrata]|uniref:Zn(2)-C6 fungal-type domain-containing protein n=1 Tax=Conoideocrella luteorostrata TaxID=1105319 RepID=A0AAJ0FZF7_9HYPO|nr:hypothetical protein QQS21_000228 [Conoideocrella luteorostrata]